MRGRTDAVVKKGSNVKIACHREALRKIVANIEDVELDIEKGKLEVAESIKAVKAWGATSEQTYRGSRFANRRFNSLSGRS